MKVPHEELKSMSFLPIVFYRKSYALFFVLSRCVMIEARVMVSVIQGRGFPNDYPL